MEVEIPSILRVPKGYFLGTQSLSSQCDYNFSSTSEGVVTLFKYTCQYWLPNITKGSDGFRMRVEGSQVLEKSNFYSWTTPGGKFDCTYETKITNAAKLLSERVSCTRDTSLDYIPYISTALAVSLLMVSAAILYFQEKKKEQ